MSDEPEGNFLHICVDNKVFELNRIELNITYFCTILEDDNTSNSRSKVVNAEQVAGRNKYLGFTSSSYLHPWDCSSALVTMPLYM